MSGTQGHLVSGRPVLVEQLTHGDVVHLEPHVARGKMVGHVQDVVVTNPRRCDAETRVALEWASCPNLLGSSPTECGCTLYERGTSVVVIGRAAA